MVQILTEISNHIVFKSTFEMILDLQEITKNDTGSSNVPFLQISPTVTFFLTITKDQNTSIPLDSSFVSSSFSPPPILKRFIHLFYIFFSFKIYFVCEFSLHTGIYNVCMPVALTCCSVPLNFPLWEGMSRGRVNGSNSRRQAGCSKFSLF